MPSRDPRIRAIEQEAARQAMADGRTSHQERFNIRARLRSEQGLGRETRKRGGVAGVWDRNKDVIVPVAAGLAGLASGGLLAPALVGGVARGFDREGKGGIGFDVGQGLRGGLEGAAYGGAAQLARGGIGALRNAFVPGGGAAGAGGGGAVASMPLADVANANVAASAPSMASRALSFAKANPEAIGMGLQGAGAALNAGAQRDIARRQMAQEDRAFNEEQERRRRIAELLAPMYNQMQSGNRPPMATPGLPRLGA